MRALASLIIFLSVKPVAAQYEIDHNVLQNQKADSRDASTGRHDIYMMNYRTKEAKKLTGDSPMKFHQSPVFVAINRN